MKKSGKHTSPRRKLTQSEAEFAAQDALAAAAGLSWSQWARQRLGWATWDVETAAIEVKK